MASAMRSLFFLRQRERERERERERDELQLLLGAALSFSTPE